MRVRRRNGGWRQWLGLFFLGGAANVVAQNQSAQPGLRWMSLRLNEASVGLESEGNWEQRSVANLNETVTRESVYVVPTLGLDVEGSVYHPNLLQYDLKGQTGVGWQENTVDTADGGTRSDSLYLLRYQANAVLFKEKPLSASFTADKDHTTRDYDFFTRATVDRESQSGRVGYSEGPVPVSLSLTHTKEDVSGQSQPLSQDENTLFFSSYNERASGNRTDLSYTLSDYTRQETGAYIQEGTQHAVSLVDHEALGKKDRFKLNSSLQFNQLDVTTTTLGQADTTTRPSTIFTDHEYLNVKHARSLQSDYNFSYNLQDSGMVKSDGYSASGALRHQLYESLTSTIDVHGQAFSSRGAGMAIDTTTHGIGLNENYTKGLGKWARLTLGYGGLFDQEHRDTLGTTLLIVGESHTLSDSAITFLDQPQVDLFSIQVWDATGTVSYRELLDYLILPHGERTEIRRVVGGQIPEGGTVRVDYTVVSQPSDSFATVAHQFQVRLDFFDGLVGLYAQMNLQEHYAAKSLVLEDINDKVMGVDVSWRWVRAGAEYEVYDSNLSPYRSTRLFETFTFTPDPTTTLNFDMGQTWRTFGELNRGLTTYHFIARTHVRMTSALSVNVEGGIRLQQGEGYDRQLATARANLEYKFGKLAMQTGYEYEDETFLGELRRRHFFFLGAKRTF